MYCISDSEGNTIYLKKEYVHFKGHKVVTLDVVKNSQTGKLEILYYCNAKTDEDNIHLFTREVNDWFSPKDSKGEFIALRPDNVTGQLYRMEEA